MNNLDGGLEDSMMEKLVGKEIVIAGKRLREEHRYKPEPGSGGLTRIELYIPGSDPVPETGSDIGPAARKIIGNLFPEAKAYTKDSNTVIIPTDELAQLWERLKAPARILS